MNMPWRSATLSGVIGAVIAVAIVFAAALLGIFPRPTDTQFYAYLMAHPDVLVAMTNKMQDEDAANEHRKRQAAISKLGLKAFFNPNVAFVTGPANAKITLVEFFDYNCPYCRASLPAMKKFYAKHTKDTRFAFIEFPIKGADSVVAARAALAAREQPDKYVAFHFALMAEQDVIDAGLLYADAQKAGLDIAKLQADMKDPKIDKAIDASHQLAAKAGIDGTPTFIVNGRVRPGAVDDELLNQLAKS